MFFSGGGILGKVFLLLLPKVIFVNKESEHILNVVILRASFSVVPIVLYLNLSSG